MIFHQELTDLVAPSKTEPLVEEKKQEIPELAIDKETIEGKNIVCQACTLENEANATVCSACGTALVVGFVENRACKSCTVLNPLNAVTCSTCGNELIDDPDKCPACTFKNAPTATKCEVC